MAAISTSSVSSPVNQPAMAMRVQRQPLSPKLYNQVLAQASTPGAKLVTLDIIEARAEGDFQTVGLLQATVMRKPGSLPPLMQLDQNSLRQEAIQSLSALTKNPATTTAAKSALVQCARGILTDKSDDVMVKAELIAAMKKAGLEPQAEHAIHQALGQLEIKSMVDALMRLPQAKPGSQLQAFA